MERYLHDEWFVTISISALLGRSVGLGIGAIVYCSLADHMTDCVVQYPDTGESEVSKQE
jgi:hypothetical protein